MRRAEQSLYEEGCLPLIARDDQRGEIAEDEDDCDRGQRVDEGGAERTEFVGCRVARVGRVGRDQGAVCAT